MTDCFRCGDDDHLSYDCPSRTRPLAAPAAALGLPPAPLSTRPEDKPVPVRRTPGEIGDYRQWPARIRRAMGWHGGETDDLRRARAAEQTAESRASRILL